MMFGRITFNSFRHGGTYAYLFPFISLRCCNGFEKPSSNHCFIQSCKSAMVFSSQTGDTVHPLIYDMNAILNKVCWGILDDFDGRKQNMYDA